MNLKCPGIDIRNLRVEEQICKSCGYEVEIFSNEIKVICPKCKADAYRENIPSCIDWCSYAKQCIRQEKYEQLKKSIDKIFLTSAGKKIAKEKYLSDTGSG